MKGSILGIIPARGGSKGLPGKNIKLLGDKPLIAHTIEEAKKSNYLERIIVTTDDIEIQKVALDYNAEVPFLRPAELAQDHTPTIDALIHCLDFLKRTEGYVPEYICLLQCTTPFKNVADIDGCIQKCLTTDYDACISVCEASSSPYWMKTFEEDKLCSFISEQDTILRRQDLPTVYEINGAVYVIRTEALLAYHSVHIENTTGYIMPQDRSIDIDTEIDFLIAEMMVKYNQESR